MNHTDMNNVDGLLRANLDRVQRQELEELEEVNDTLRAALSDITIISSALLSRQRYYNVDGSPDTHYVAEILTVRDLLREVVDNAGFFV